MFAEFISQLGPLKNGELPFSFRNQFKIRENFINPNSKHFDGIVLMAEEKQGMKRKWDKQCKMMFIWVLGKFFQLKNKKSVNPNQKEWVELSELLKTEESILKQRWITLINPVSKTITWDPEEDDIIRSLMNEQEEKHIWTQIALELYNNNSGQFIRTPKQVRERWMNYLNPKLKKSIWTLQEDTQLLEVVIKHGKRWSFISNLLQGRTENQVKNRFKSLIQKISKNEEQDDVEEIQAIKDYLQKIDTIKNSQNTLEPSLQVEKKQKKKIEKVEKITKKIKIKKTALKKEKYILKQEEENMENNQIIEKQEELIQNFVKQNESILQQDPLPLIYQQPSQFYNENNNIQTPNTLSYYLQPQIQQQQKQQLMFQAYRPFMDDFSQQQQQLTPQQIMMEQYLKRQSGYNGVSPYPFNQTPMTYNPVQQMYAYNNQFVVRSPQMMCSPYLENQSPINQYWQIQQQYMEQIQQEQLKQAQFNNKMEFLNQNNLLDDWKRKRDSKKVNQMFQSNDQQDQ